MYDPKKELYTQTKKIFMFRLTSLYSCPPLAHRKKESHVYVDQTNTSERKTKVFLSLVAVRTGLEPVTPCVTGMYSNQLN